MQNWLLIHWKMQHLKPQELRMYQVQWQMSVIYSIINNSLKMENE